MKLNKLALGDKPLFQKYLQQTSRPLSPYSFANMYVWRDLCDILWQECEGTLCVFFKEKRGGFLYLPPLGKTSISDAALRGIFSILDAWNKNPAVSRIENIPEQGIPFFTGRGLRVYEKPGDYLCKRVSIERFAGDAFKSQRAARNYFVKHNRFEYLPYLSSDAPECLALFDAWKKERSAKIVDAVYRGMIDDTRTTVAIALRDAGELGFIGRIVRIDGTIRAFTLGYQLNEDTFCVMFEITDLSVKGISQFIFSSLCRELERYTFVNIMDDSGLENLKRTKRAYHPVRIVPNYVAVRAH